MISPARLERTYRAAAFATFVASFGFTLGCVAYYLFRFETWGMSVAWCLFAPFLSFHLLAGILAFWTAASYARSNRRSAIRSLAKPFRWVLAGHASFILQAVAISLWIDHLKAS